MANGFLSVPFKDTCTIKLPIQKESTPIVSKHFFSGKLEGSGTNQTGEPF